MTTAVVRKNVKERLGVRLRTLRKAQGLSQEAFAATCGLDRTYVSGIERGVRNPSLEILERLALALSISVSELLKNV